MASNESVNWQTEGLRLTAFVSVPMNPTGMNFWEQLMGDSPDEVRRRPQEQFFREEGPFFEGRLSVEARKDRIDWRLGHDPKNLAGSLPKVGPYQTLSERFRQLMLNWLDNCPVTSRLAYGAVLFVPADSIPQACQILEPLLPIIQTRWENTHDFQYRINRRRRSSCGVEGLEINRMATWSVVTISGVQLDFISGRLEPSLTPIRSNGMCRLELDVNTSPERQLEMDESLRLPIFNELVDFGNEIASQGDIP